MSDRWSFSNSTFPITYNQFVGLTKAFREAAEKSFGPVKMDIRILNGARPYDDFRNDTLRIRLESITGKYTPYETAQLEAVTKQVWQEAHYVEITVRPEDAAKAQEAYARLEFKGALPRQATFFVQGGNGTEKEAVATKKGLATITGDGSITNTLRPRFF